jgi:S-adenosylmethionine hydrolase
VIVLFTDFGPCGPYLGQMEMALRKEAPSVDVIQLLSDAPAGDPRRSAYLLAALARHVPLGAVVLAVVDPGVGSKRLPVVLQADGRTFVGPDNGLFNTVALHSLSVEWRIIDWRPDSLSASFHGRDLFAPIAAHIARNDSSWPGRSYAGPELGLWPADLPEIIYVDHYGNAISGLRYQPELEGRCLEAQGRRLAQVGTFADVEAGEAFWYCNSMGLVEIAVNRGRADQALGLSLGTEIRFV